MCKQDDYAAMRVALQKTIDKCPDEKLMDLISYLHLGQFTEGLIKGLERGREMAEEDPRWDDDELMCKAVACGFTARRSSMDEKIRVTVDYISPAEFEQMQKDAKEID